MLAGKLRVFHDSLCALGPAKAQDLCTRLANFTFSHWLIARTADLPLRLVHGFSVWITVVLLPPAHSRIRTTELLAVSERDRNVVAEIIDAVRLRIVSSPDDASDVVERHDALYRKLENDPEFKGLRLRTPFARPRLLCALYSPSLPPSRCFISIAINTAISQHYPRPLAEMAAGRRHA